jgi:hypothetical protein
MAQAIVRHGHGYGARSKCRLRHLQLGASVPLMVYGSCLMWHQVKELREAELLVIPTSAMHSNKGGQETEHQQSSSGGRSRDTTWRDAIRP